MTQETYLNMGELKTMNGCSIKREKQVQNGKKEIPEVLASDFCVTLLKDILFGRCKREDADAQIDAFYDMLDFPTEQTRLAKKEDMKRCLYRYLDSEKHLLTELQPVKATIFGVNVNIKPDVMTYDPISGSIHIIKYYYKKPDVKQNGRKVDHCANHHMGLYSLLWYGEHMLSPGMNGLIRASLYFLKQDSDKPFDNTFHSDFFDPEGKNVITIEQWYEGGSNNLKYWDEKYKSIFENFAKGSIHIYDKEDCKNCSLKAVCSYKDMPMPVPFVKKITRLDKIPYTTEQKQVINHVKGVARINAGAGTGKTLTVALRTVGLLRKGFHPDEICLLTFTESGAKEMRERIVTFCNQLQLPIDPEQLKIGTFNGFENDIIMENYHLLGYAKPPRVADDVERFSIIAELLRFSDVPHLDYRNFYLQSKYLKGALPFTKKVFDLIKSNELTNTEEGRNKLVNILKKETITIENDTMDALFPLYEKYQQLMHQSCLIDYTDQELLVFEIYKKHPTLFEDMGIKHIIVDEFQDSVTRFAIKSCDR